MANVDIAKKIEFTLAERVKQKLPKDIVQRGARLVAQLTLQEVKDRTNAGVDVNQIAFKEYSEKYRLYQKPAFITGSAQNKKGLKAHSGSYSNRSVKRTPYAAKKVHDYMRLSGQMFSAMTIRQVQGIDDEGFIGGRFILDFRTEEMRNRARYNIANGYNFWGLSPTTTARGRAFRTKTKSALKAFLGIRGGGNLSINEA